MPIHLITGLPGACKTLYTLDHVSKLSDKENRQVYYHNINDLKLDWSEMGEPSEWSDLPNGTIIVIDECQDVFPVMKIGAQKPDFYTLLAKHRHDGKDIFLITQDPMLIDIFVRKLVDLHTHCVRKGNLTSTLYYWTGGYADTKKDRYKAKKTFYQHPKDFFDKYRSAEIHTIKSRLNKKAFFVLPLLLGAFGYLLYFAYSWISEVAVDAVDTMTDLTDDLPSTDDVVDTVSMKSSTPASTIPTVIERRTVNSFSIGVFEEMNAYYLGHFNGNMFFDVDGIFTTQQQLERLGYSVTKIDECLVKVDVMFFTCPPDPNSIFLAREEAEGSDQEPSAPRSSAIRTSSRAVTAVDEWPLKSTIISGGVVY